MKYKKCIIFGGLDIQPTWDEYLELVPKLVDIVGDPTFVGDPEITRGVFKRIREDIESKKLIGKTADNAANDYEYRDKITRTIYSFSWRAWGDLMSAIIGKREGYMCYYM